jgi:arylsulfatase
MNRTFRRLSLITALVASVAMPAAVRAADPAPKRPNFLIIVADDLGFSDIGAFGGDVDTPNLDRLAARGLRLTGFHTAPTCSPTRSMLLSGTDNHDTGFGTMAELLADNQKGKPGHEGYLRSDVAALPELLAAGGYRTLYSGKWHLGVEPRQDPHARGFQTSFALLQGGHNHFGTDISAVPGKGSTYTENGHVLSRLPENFYSSDTFATKLVEQIKASKAGRDGAKPFFAYLAFTAPHWPLQAPAETIAKYKGRYDAGYEVLRSKRLERQVALGLLDPAVAAHPFDLARPWASLSDKEKSLAAHRMEVYAAMIDRLDQNVGRVIDTLEQTGELDDTIILFLSDNGAEGMELSAATHAFTRERYAKADNSLGNLGAASSYDSYGPGWAEAATAPSWRVKAYETEGGTRTVSFIAGPGIKDGIGRAFTSVMDVVPTFLDLAGLPRPEGRLGDRPVKPIKGLSWASWLRGDAETVYAPDKVVGAELFGGRALRKGDWKITDKGDGNWQLFNIASDPGETRDLSAQEAGQKAELVKAWENYAANVGVIIPNPPVKILAR